MNKMNIDQVHDCCLKIAIEFDKICTKHNIPYYMVCGTMLGAVRHKGFIPWDDDMDFGVPYEYYDDLVRILKEELPSPYKCSTYLDSSNVFFPFFKIEDISTILDDVSLTEPFENKIGVNIDIFPLFHCVENDFKIKIGRKICDLIGIIYTNTRTGGRIRAFVKRILRFSCPFSANRLANISLKFVKSAKTGTYLHSVYGGWYGKECVPEDWYGKGVKYEFEGYLFSGVMEYDKYLTQLYGNYMELPPISKRRIHCEDVYYR